MWARLLRRVFCWVQLGAIEGFRGLLERFLQAYQGGVVTKNLTLRFAERVAVQFGTHLCFWMPQNKWGRKEDTIRMVQIGADILTMVEAHDWARLRKSALRDLFIGVV